MSEWRDIETAPKDGKSILLTIEPVDCYELCGWRPEHFVTVTIGWWDGDRWSSALMEEGTADTEGYSSAIAISIRPTHWMPLPEPPGTQPDRLSDDGEVTE